MLRSLDLRYSTITTSGNKLLAVVDSGINKTQITMVKLVNCLIPVQILTFFKENSVLQVLRRTIQIVLRQTLYTLQERYSCFSTLLVKLQRISEIACIFAGNSLHLLICVLLFLYVTYCTTWRLWLRFHERVSGVNEG